MSGKPEESRIQRFLSCWFRDGVDAVSSRLPGGDLNDCYRAEKNNQAFVLRIYTRSSTRKMVEEELEVVQRMSERLPEVLPPIAALSGDPCVECGGRVATLSDFAEGERPERTKALRRAAADLLARIHLTGSELGVHCHRSTYPPIKKLNWQSNRWWDLRDV